MTDYPDDLDLRVVVEDKLDLKEAQRRLRSDLHLLANTNKKENMSKPMRYGNMGRQNLNEIKKKIMEKDNKTKSTAFYLIADTTNEELQEHLESQLRSDQSDIDTNLELSVAGITPSEDNNSFGVDLSYEHKMPTRRNFLNSEDRLVHIDIGTKMEDETRIISADYRQNDEFTAITKFLEGWRMLRLQERMEPIHITNVDLSVLPLDDRVELFADFFTTHPGDWSFEHVSELGIERQKDDNEDLTDEEEEIILEETEEMEAKLDQNLAGLTNAILEGREGLLESGFVSDCLEQDFYFTSAKLFFSNTRDISGIEIKVKFKQNPRPAFVVSFEEYYEKQDNKYISNHTSEENRDEIRDLFRGVLMNLYAEKTNQQNLIQAKYTAPLTDLEGIGPETAQSLSDELNITSPQEVFSCSVDELQEVSGIGETRAKALSREG